MAGEVGDRYYEAEALTHLGNAHRAAGNAAAADDAWQHAVEILDDLGHPDAEQVRVKLKEIDHCQPPSPMPS